jgi:hypothetical protein
LITSGSTFSATSGTVGGANLGTIAVQSGGTLYFGGTVNNSGTLFASGAHSLVDISSGATVTGGGIAKIGNGILDIEGPRDNQNVVFQSGGTGGLELGVLGSAYTGTVSGFGQNIHQFIDFTAIGSPRSLRSTFVGPCWHGRRCSTPYGGGRSGSAVAARSFSQSRRGEKRGPQPSPWARFALVG